MKERFIFKISRRDNIKALALKNIWKKYYIFVTYFDALELMKCHKINKIKVTIL